jgi:hypothetical protein
MTCAEKTRLTGLAHTDASSTQAEFAALAPHAFVVVAHLRVHEYKILTFPSEHITHKMNVEMAYPLTVTLSAPR